MFENLDGSTIATIVLGLIGTFASGFWLKAKGKISKVINLAREVIEAATVMEAALEDDKLTKKEIEGIKKEFNDIKVSFKSLTSKDKK